jgi:hypothetical protein
MGVIWKSACTYLRHLPFGSLIGGCEIGVLLGSQRSESRSVDSLTRSLAVLAFPGEEATPPVQREQFCSDASE